MNKYEKLIEYIISEQNDLARELFHEIVVEKSRSIYESLSEADYEEGVHHGDKVDALMNEIDADHEGVAEADNEMSDMDSDMPDLGSGMSEVGDDEGEMPEVGDDEEDMGDEGSMPEMGDDEEDMGDEGEEDLEDRVMDLESAIDELKAEFDKLMAGEDEGEEGEGEEEEANEGMVREYVEKVAAPANKEGHEVGKGGSASINANTVGLQNSNNMGGKRFDLGKGTEVAPDGQSPKATVKAPQEIDVAKRNVNKVGGNKGAEDFYGTKAKAKSGEEGGVNKSSIESGK